MTELKWQPPPSTHNQPKTLVETARANMESGLWLLCKEALVTAIQDRRLDRSHLKVLAVIAHYMDKHTALSSPSRQVIAAAIGVEVSTVSNALSELRLLGYLVSERQHDEATNRKLTFYSFGNIDHDTIRREITKFVDQIKAMPERNSSPPRVNKSDAKPSTPEQNTSPPRGKFTTQGEQNSSPPRVNITSQGEQSAVQNDRSKKHSLLKSLDSNLEVKPYTPPQEETSPQKVNSEKAKRGSRLPDDWRLPKSWGEWTVENFRVTAQQVRVEAERFKNHWLAKAGKEAIKVDWYRTWQNWCASDFRAWPRRSSSTDALSTEAQAEADSYSSEWDKARAMLGGDDDA